MAAIMSLPHQLNSPWAAFASTACSGSGFNVIQPPHLSNPFHNLAAPLSPPITPTFSASATTSSTLPLPLPTSLPSAHTQPWLNTSHPFGSSQPNFTTSSFSSPSAFTNLPSAPSPFSQQTSPFASAPAAYSSPSPSLFPNAPSHSFSSPAPAASFGSPSVSAFPSSFSTASHASTLPFTASPNGFPTEVKQQQPKLAPSVLSRKRAFTQTETEPQPSVPTVAPPPPSPFTQASFGSSNSAASFVSAPLGKRTLTQASAVHDDDTSAVRTVGKRTKTRLESAVEALSGCVPTETDDEEDDRILKRVRKPSSFNTTLIDEYKEGERLFEPIVDAIPESIRQPLRIPREMALVPSRSIRFKSNIIPLRPDDREAWFGDNPSLSPFSSAFPTHSPAFFAPITPDTCFCLLNTEGRILEADSKLIRLLKISDASSLTGTSLLTFFHRDEWHKAQGTVARLMHNLSRVKDSQSFVTQSFSHRMHDSIGNRFSICGRLYAFRFKGEPLIVCKLVPLGSEADRALIDSATARVWNSASCPPSSSSSSSLSTSLQELDNDVPPRPSSVFISEMAAGEYHHPSALSTSVPSIVTVDEEEHEALESDDVNMS